MSTFSRWLDEAMTRRQMSCRMLATLSRVDHATVSRVRRGQTDPRMATAHALAAALGQTFVIGTDQPVYVEPHPLTDAERSLAARNLALSHVVRPQMTNAIAGPQTGRGVR